MTTNTIIGCLLRGLGDSIQQRIELSHKKILISTNEVAETNKTDLQYNWQRTCKMIFSLQTTI